ncbi:hypothetical protein [Kocuria sp. ZOR0020]|uniref:hypothetical protein n=1 Tax=Kocuria sp. ZOR0020 TaxID=1339234 RepID=UPI000645DF1D|nr:hypothetical protein [Kocuria sp. ZOR0020]
MDRPSYGSVHPSGLKQQRHQTQADSPNTEPADRTHNRIRHDKVNEGSITLRNAGRLHHIGIGRRYNNQPVILIAQNREITVIHATTGEILRELTLDPTHDYQPQKNTKSPNP